MFLSAEPLMSSVESLLMSRVVAGSLWPYRLKKNLRLQALNKGGSSTACQPGVLKVKKRKAVLVRGGDRVSHGL
jgi:hypothetical protein